MSQIQCQVMQRIEEWPYVERCKLNATHKVKTTFTHVGGTPVEYVCDKHNDELNGAYADSTEPLQNVLKGLMEELNDK